MLATIGNKERKIPPAPRASSFGITLFPDDWASLANEQKLLDAPICAAAGLIRTTYPNIQVFDTQFLAALIAGKWNYERTKHWARRHDYANVDKLFVPVHEPAREHWTLIIVDFKAKFFVHYDPLGPRLEESWHRDEEFGSAPGAPRRS